jgi:quinone-modifying oxidoreductase subunit QmoA
MADIEPVPSLIKADILVVGGGIAGMTAAIEAAEIGKSVVLLERTASLGGRVAAMNQYFPKLCPPTCGIEINLRRIRVNPCIRVLTLAEVGKISGAAGNYDIQVKLNPRYVNEKCTACGDCEKACEVERDDDFNFGLSRTKAIYLPHLMAYPARYVIDPKYIKDPSMKKVVDSCKYGAIDLNMTAQDINLKVGSIVWATGWKPYDATRIDNLGFGKHKNVVTNVIMERLASENGPSGGKIVRPSDGKEIKSIGFVQCAGSRDENHLPYCSSVCCLASMKQATYVRTQYPEADIHMFYIDVRSPGRMEDFYVKVQQDQKFHFHRGKVGNVSENPATGNIILEAENTLTGVITKTEVDMAVLAIGMVPNTADDLPSIPVTRDPYGFLVSDDSSGIVGAGAVLRPCDVANSVQQATGAAMQAICAAGRK